MTITLRVRITKRIVRIVFQQTRPALTFVQLEGKCYCCGKAGHKLPQCYMKSKIPKEEWAINKVQMTQVNKDQSVNNNEIDTSSSTENEKNIGWAGVHVLFLQGESNDKFAEELKTKIAIQTLRYFVMKITSMRYGIPMKEWK